MFLMMMAVSVAMVPRDDAGAVTTISGTGEGGWEVICQTLAGGDQKFVILNGSRRSASVHDLLKASCQVKNSQKAPLVISITAPALECPFAKATADTCQQTFEKGAASSFEFKRKSRGV